MIDMQLVSNFFLDCTEARTRFRNRNIFGTKTDLRPRFCSRSFGFGLVMSSVKHNQRNPPSNRVPRS